MVAEAPVETPTADDEVEPTETPESEAGDVDSAATETPPPKLEDLISDENIGEVLELPALKAQLDKMRSELKEQTQEEVRKAEDRARNRTLAEQRKRWGDPAAVSEAAKSILRESGIDDDLSRSQQDRLNTLLATFQEQAANAIATEIPRFFFGNYKLPQDVLESYQDHVNASDTDGAFRALIDGAIALRQTELESEYKQKAEESDAEFEKRVKAEVGQRVKAELETANQTETKELPGGKGGSAAGRTKAALTTAEIARLPMSAWKNLPSDVKAQIQANVIDADRERGAETVDLGQIERVAGMAER